MSLGIPCNHGVRRMNNPFFPGLDIAGTKRGIAQKKRVQILDQPVVMYVSLMLGHEF